MKKQVEVVAAIIENEGRFFCAQRKNTGELALKWEFPGGKIEFGETYEQALIREVKEELDTTIRVIKHIMTIDHEYQSFIIRMHCFYCEVISGHLQINEHINSNWLTPQEMLSYDFAQADVPVVLYLNKSK